MNGTADGQTVAFMDVGTNSVRVIVVRIQPNQAITILTQQKEVVRLAEGEFADGFLHADAIDRAVLVCSKFAELARTYGSAEIVAVATAATREAKNQSELLQRLRREAKLDVRIVSGLEEARLIYLGVASGVHLGDSPALFIDIGGGSTELAIGDAHHHAALASVKIGAARLTDLFFLPEEEEPVTPARYALVRRYAQNASIRAIQLVSGHPVTGAYGSSGTIENLADVAFATLHDRRRRREDALAREDLSQVVSLLCSLPLTERRRVAGIDPDRADIILAGAAILECVMDALGLAEIRVTDRGLREGLIVDYLERTEHAELARSTTVRERSVLQLGRACGFNEAHARHIADLALMLFDSAVAAGFVDLGASEREMLGHAAMLHDIGGFLSYSNHHRHTYYLIRHTDLLGFDQREQAIIACTARFHRRGMPSRKRPELGELGRRDVRTVRYLSVLLRLAEKLDRSHGGLVAKATFRSGGKRSAVLEVVGRSDCQLELWGVASEVPAFERVFGRTLRVDAAIDPQLALPEPRRNGGSAPATVGRNGSPAAAEGRDAGSPSEEVEL